MAADKSQFDDSFGKMLNTALASGTPPVHSGFTDGVLKEVRAAEERKILARVILQERLALAGCIIMPLGILVFILAFPELILDFSELVKDFCTGAVQTAMAGQLEWQFIGALAVGITFAVYTAYDLFTADG